MKIQTLSEQFNDNRIFENTLKYSGGAGISSCDRDQNSALIFSIVVLRCQQDHSSPTLYHLTEMVSIKL